MIKISWEKQRVVLHRLCARLALQLTYCTSLPYKPPKAESMLLNLCVRSWR